MRVEAKRRWLPLGVPAGVEAEEPTSETSTGGRSESTSLAQDSAGASLSSLRGSVVSAAGASGSILLSMADISSSLKQHVNFESDVREKRYVQSLAFSVNFDFLLS